MTDLLQRLPRRLERRVAELLQPNEEVYVRLKGSWKEALVCTDRRAIIVKAGFMTGHFFGANVFQMAYERISNVEVKFKLLTGYFEISGGGMANTEKSNWNLNGGEANYPAKAPNCVTLDLENVKAFRKATNVIMAAMSPVAAQTYVAPQREDPVALLERLAVLVERGLMTLPEFELKKSEILARI